MKETSFRITVTSRLSQIYTDSNHGLIPWEKPNAGFPMIDNARLESGGAGLISTIDDYSRFARMLLEGGTLEGVQILRPETIALMASDHLTPAQKATYGWIDEEGYSYGFMVRVMVNPAKSYYPTESPGAFGWNGLAGTSIRIDPAKGTTLVFMVQRVPPVHMDYLPPLVQAMSDYLD
jgi:CubicO group peptidase (beta-lactamase class C family)